MFRRRFSDAPQSGDVPDGSAVAIVRRVLPYLWPAGAPALRLRVALALAALLSAKLIAVATPFFYKAAVDTLSGEAGADAAWTLGAGAVALTVAYGGSRALGTLFQQARDAAFALVGQQALRRLANRSFRHIHALSLGYHLSRRTGGLSRIMERGIKGVEFLLRVLLLSLGPLILEMVLVAVILTTLFGPAFLGIMAATIVAYAAFTFSVTEWRVGFRREMVRQDTDATQKAIDSLLNYETVKYFGASAREADRYDTALGHYVSAAMRSSYSLAALNAGQSLIVTAGLVGVMVLAAMGVAGGTMTTGDFVMANAYMIQITMPLGLLGTVYREMRTSLVDMGALFGLLDRVPEVRDRSGAHALRVDRGRVRFRDVSFGYEAEREILRGVDLEIPGGRTLALVGATGAGKSTVGRLLFRFYDVTGGAIEIDGQDIRDVTQDSLHAAIGVVPQDTVLFNDTLFYNIAYGRPDATRGEVEAAARAARLHDFVAGLPRGYETEVGERGLKLSGGERQRVGIARTLLKDPAVLILDEATSALDTETEEGIQSELKSLGRARTTLVIAHRLSTIADADEIVVMEAGRVAERGSHAQLLARHGRYARLWMRQIADDAA